MSLLPVLKPGDFLVSFLCLAWRGYLGGSGDTGVPWSALNCHRLEFPYSVCG